MIKFLAEELSLRLVANNVITIDKRKFYTYGIELILHDFFIFLMVTITALITNTFLISIIFTCTFCLLRAFTGGYHSKSYSGCFLTALLNYFSMLLLNTLLDKWKLAFEVGIMILSIPIIWKCAPVENENRSFDEKERKKYGKISRILISMLSIFFVLFVAFLSDEIAFIIAWSAFATSILMVLAIILQKKEEISNEETMS